MDENQFSMDVDEVVWTLVKRGFAEGKDEIGESFRQMYEDVDNVPSQEVVEAAVDAALNRFRDEMDSWPVETDCDRLTQAFEQLEEEGRIVAREDFACCQTCGRSEIGDDIEGVLAFRGFVFYHSQDTDSAVEGGSLFLAFGTFEDEGDAAAIRVGQKICDVLATHKLETEWNGSNKTRSSCILTGSGAFLGCCAVTGLHQLTVPSQARKSHERRKLHLLHLLFLLVLLHQMRRAAKCLGGGPGCRGEEKKENKGLVNPSHSF